MSTKYIKIYNAIICDQNDLENIAENNISDQNLEMRLKYFK